MVPTFQKKVFSRLATADNALPQRFKVHRVELGDGGWSGGRENLGATCRG